MQLVGLTRKCLSRHRLLVNILTDTLSYSHDLLEANDFIIDNVSLFETRKELLLVLVLFKRGGSTLMFFIGVDIEATQLLQRFALFTSKGGIAEIFLL